MPKRSYPNIRWRDGVAQLDVIINGHRNRESLHTSNFNEAVERRDKRIAELREGTKAESASWHTPGQKPPTVTWDEMRAYDLDRARLVSTESVVMSGLGCAWNRLKTMFPDAHAVSNDALGQYARAQLRAGYSAQTIRRDVWAVMRGYEWAQEREPSLPTFKKRLKLKASPKGIAAGQFIDLYKLHQMADELKPASLAALLIHLTTGLRAEEYKRFKIEWLRGHDGRTLFIDVPEHCAKWGKARTIPVPRYIAALLHHQDFSVNYRKAWATAAKRVKLGRVVRRDLRKTFSTTMAPVDAYGIDLVMGHQKLGTVAHRYQDANDARLAVIADAIDDKMPWVRGLAERAKMGLICGRV